MPRIDIEHMFSYHRPTEEQAKRYDQLRGAARVYARVIADLTPESPEQTLALRKLHEVSMQANAAIAMNEPDVDGNTPDGGTYSDKGLDL